MNNPNPWCIYLISDMKTWSHDMGYAAPTEHFDSVELAVQRYNQIRPEQTAHDPSDLTYNGLACARMTIGIERENGASATDLLQVRYGRNVLCDDFTRKERICQDADALGLIATLSERIKFDLVMAVTDDGRPHIILPQQWGSLYLHVAFPDIKQPDYLKQFASLQDDGYMILQLKQTDDTRDLRFEPYRRVKEQIDVANYVPMYAAPLQIQHDVNVTLEWLFGTFNGTIMRIPDDFHGHSLSVSSIISLSKGSSFTSPPASGNGKLNVMLRSQLPSDRFSG